MRHIQLIGKGALPEPRKISEDELLSPALDCQWVEVPAVITGVENDDRIFTLTVEVHGWKLKALIPRDEHSAERVSALMQRTVRLQGISGTLFTPRQQMTGRYFYVPSFDQLIPTDSAAPNTPPPAAQGQRTAAVWRYAQSPRPGRGGCHANRRERFLPARREWQRHGAHGGKRFARSR